MPLPPFVQLQTCQRPLPVDDGILPTKLYTHRWGGAHCACRLLAAAYCRLLAAAAGGARLAIQSPAMPGWLILPPA
jgi:hypothetical protein